MKPYWKPRFIVMDNGLSMCENTTGDMIGYSCMATFAIIDGETTRLLPDLVEAKLNLDFDECKAILKGDIETMFKLFRKMGLVAREQLRERYSVEELPIIIRSIGNTRITEKCKWRL